MQRRSLMLLYLLQGVTKITGTTVSAMEDVFLRLYWESSEGVLIDTNDPNDITKDNNNCPHHIDPSPSPTPSPTPTPTPTSEIGVTSPTGTSPPTPLPSDKFSSEDEWHSDEESPNNSSFGLMVTERSSQQDINEIMNTKKWLGLKSSDKSFRQQLDGIFHHEKKQKKQKNKKKMGAESSPEQDDEQEGSSERHTEFGKENTMVRFHSSKKTRPFLSHSISCDDHSPVPNRKNLSQQQIDINNHANLLRRTCRFLSDSSATFHMTSSLRPVTYFGETNSKTSMMSSKRLARSQYNLSHNSDYVNRSQSLGDLTGDLGFVLPRSSQKSLNTYNSSTSNISTCSSSTKTITNGASRTNLRQSAPRTAGGLYAARYEKSRLNSDRHSKSFDSVTHQAHPKISSRQLSQPESYHENNNAKQNGSENSLHTGQTSTKSHHPHDHYMLQAHKKHSVQHGQQHVSTTGVQPHQQKIAIKSTPTNLTSKSFPSKTSGMNVSNTNRQQPHPSHLSMSAKTSRPKPICESNVVDQHRKYGSTDCINKLKPRRSLPRVPSENIDEKRRKFTELMKQRILLCSTSSSNNSGNADTPLDYEVSSLLSLNELDTNDNGSDSLKFKPIESAADVWKFQSLQDLSCHDQQHEKELGGGEWKRIIPVICNESSVCSTQANRRSHSSTMDSGYSTIDTEVEPYVPPSRIKPVINQNKPETEKNLCKSREFGSVDCLQVNTLGQAKGYHYPGSGSVKIKQAQDYSTLTSAHTGGAPLHGISRWETKSLSTQNLNSRSPRKTEGPSQAQNYIKSCRSSSNLNDNNNMESTFGHFVKPSNKSKSQNPNNSGTSNSPTSDNLNNASLHQLLQLYTLYPAELGAATLKSCLNDCIFLKRKIVQLPVMSAVGINNSSSGSLISGPGSKSVPQGKYTKLGGPGSAFRPVRSVSGLVNMCQVSMTGIVFKSNRLSPPPVALSAIEDGDLVVEVNGVLVLDQNTQAIQKLFYSTLDSDLLQLTLAHPKRAPINSLSNSLANEEVQSLKEDIKLLSNELERKEKIIKQLNGEKLSSNQTTRSSCSASPSVYSQCQYNQDWTKNLDSLHLGEDEFVV